MSWMDLSDYLVIEESAAARIDDLRDEAASHATVDMPAPACPVARRAGMSGCEWLRSASMEAP